MWAQAPLASFCTMVKAGGDLNAKEQMCVIGCGGRDPVEDASLCPPSRKHPQRRRRCKMPTFELVVLYRQLNNPALKTAIKRSANYLFDFGATIRKMTNLGFRDMPYYIKRKGVKHYTAHYIVYDFDSGADVPKPLRDKLMLDLDVVRATTVLVADSPIDLHFPPPTPECTMHLDLLPPPYRENIIKLQMEAENKATKRHTHKNYEDKQFLIF